MAAHEPDPQRTNRQAARVAGPLSPHPSISEEGEGSEARQVQLRDIAAEEARQMEQVLEGAAGPSGVAPPAEHVPLQRNPTWFEKKHKQSTVVRCS